MSTASVRIREVQREDREGWIELRAALWPDEPAVGAEADEYFASGTIAGMMHGVFVAEAGEGGPSDGLVGFAECSLRPADEASPAGRRAHLEGWYVRPAGRRQGIGRALIAAVEAWARRGGCAILTSDTSESYALLSVPAHRGCGFEVEGPAAPAGAAFPGDGENSIRFWRRIRPAGPPPQAS
jgi:aminoglycoside 6'-N-acetyltransferase I